MLEIKIATIEELRRDFLDFKFLALVFVTSPISLSTIKFSVERTTKIGQF